MPTPSTRRHATRLIDQLPPLPEDMKGNQGRERARYGFVIRTLKVLATDGAVTGDRAEDWRRVSRQLTFLWQMARFGDFRMTVAGLCLISREAEALEPEPVGLPAGTGPNGGDLIFPWQATADDWVAVVSVVGGPAGLFVEASMAMPNLRGIARTVIIVDRGHRFHRGGLPHADVLIDSTARIERLDADVERARANEQWKKNRQEWHGA
ncbi:hypothetical protein ABZ896_12410 [Streptomyces sp. NPDC047072]|uniref:hypothetical protein n=1 Tax=Streptomyces sp. NPDC047072 TaxID=3154809 RepID=UPI0033F1511F